MSQDLKKIYDDVFLPPEGKRKSSFSRFFPYRNEKDFKAKIDLVYDEYYSINGSYDYDPELYTEAIKNVVKKSTSNKDTLIAVYKEYDSFLADKYGLEISTDYPPIPISNTFERLMYIAKYLQEDESSIADIPEKLWQSSRTIEKDLAKLQGNDGDPLQVCGQKFVIHETDRSMGHISFGSTAHPFFLTCNLTQVIAALEGLKIMSERPGFEGYAMPLARNIWRQLSDYGRKRIFHVMENLLCQDPSWYKSLDEEDEYSYRTEMECSGYGTGVLMYCLKNGDREPCYVEYKNGEESEFLSDVRVLQYGEEGLKVSVGGKERILDPHKVIRSSLHKETMY